MSGVVERNFAVGIDVGGGFTKACIAQIPRPGQAPGVSRIVINDVSNRETPTVVAIEKEQRLIGEPAKNAIVSNGANTCTLLPFALCAIGDAENAEIVKACFATQECAVTADAEQFTFKPTNCTASMSIEQIFVAYLARITEFARLDVESVHSEAKVKHVVLVVPDTASRAYRATLGKVLHALGYGYDLVELSRVLAHSYVAKHRHAEARRIFFIDIGETTTNMSIVDIKGKSDKNAVAVAPTTNTKPQLLGTRDFVEVICDIVRKVLLDKHACTVEPKTKDWTRLQRAANKSLQVLSANKVSMVNLENFAGDRDFQIEVTRDEFERICTERNFPDKFKAIIAACEEAQPVQAVEIHSVELTGGGSRVPFVKKIIQAHFGDNRVCTTLDGSMAASQGAVELFTSGCTTTGTVTLTDAETESAVALAAVEAEWKARDTAFQQIGEVKNAHESRIYKYRDLLRSHGGLIDDKEELESVLQSAEDFLFDNWDTFTFESITKVSTELEEIWKSKSTRYADHIQAEDARKKADEAKLVAERLAEEAIAGSQDYDTRKLKKPERMKKVVKNKEEGNELLKGGQSRMAIDYYNKALAHCDKFFDLSKEDEGEVDQIKVGLFNNIAQANIKLKEWKKAVSAADSVLAIDALNTKALYRKAVGLEGSHSYKDALKVLEQALGGAPTDKERKSLESLVSRVTDLKAKEDARSKKVFSKMFG